MCVVCRGVWCVVYVLVCVCVCCVCLRPAALDEARVQADVPDVDDGLAAR